MNRPRGRRTGCGSPGCGFAYRSSSRLPSALPTWAAPFANKDALSLRYIAMLDVNQQASDVGVAGHPGTQLPVAGYADSSRRESPFHSFAVSWGCSSALGIARPTSIDLPCDAVAIVRLSKIASAAAALLLLGPPQAVGATSPDTSDDGCAVSRMAASYVQRKLIAKAKLGVSQRCQDVYTTRTQHPFDPNQTRVWPASKSKRACRYPPRPSRCHGRSAGICRLDQSLSERLLRTTEARQSSDCNGVAS